MSYPGESRHTSEPELKTWVPAEYEAGYEARFAGASESVTATPCWQAGWQDADTSALLRIGFFRTFGEPRKALF
jgi:hypothetical protein